MKFSCKGPNKTVFITLELIKLNCLGVKSLPNVSVIELTRFLEVALKETLVFLLTSKANSKPFTYLETNELFLNSSLYFKIPSPFKNLFPSDNLFSKVKGFALSFLCVDNTPLTLKASDCIWSNLFKSSITLFFPSAVFKEDVLIEIVLGLLTEILANFLAFFKTSNLLLSE